MSSFFIVYNDTKLGDVKARKNGEIPELMAQIDDKKDKSILYSHFSTH
ncbi:hypothetical protein AQPE_2201 [Aquipluma nitroreducens]|uniref:Uncharacterized protein n=1 Tax=Aquipluma nitroreducens TaxID=2010828 RepID=A0A5K7S904_9BACT|nr:hypothetical protein AQPE_2201 [Aquipluma nitroreducens]